ncbi:methyltransferase domain-containing protein [Streptomyces lavendulocolor]
MSTTPADGGKHGGEPDGPGIATPSNAQPSMVARMLRLLAVEDGHRVLEIGTASGYVAALLSRRLGDSAVYSVEVDPGLAHHAVAVLRAAGYRPDLACGDGEWGWPDQAPFDRIIATCALREVPHALMRQLTSGGVLVAPMARDFWSGALVRLTADGRGAASGRFHGGASYMHMRSHRPPPPAPVDDTTVRPVEAAVDPRDMLSLGFALYAGARMPGYAWSTPTGAVTPLRCGCRTPTAPPPPPSPGRRRTSTGRAGCGGRPNGSTRSTSAWDHPGPAASGSP